MDTSKLKSKAFLYTSNKQLDIVVRKLFTGANVNYDQQESP